MNLCTVLKETGQFRQRINVNNFIFTHRYSTSQKKFTLYGTNTYVECNNFCFGIVPLSQHKNGTLFFHIEVLICKQRGMLNRPIGMVWLMAR